MSSNDQTVLGSVAGLWRYPVKSMLGEELDVVEITGQGLAGDRAYALVDGSDGRVATAKNPRKWPRLFDCEAAFVSDPIAGARNPLVRITLPDGTIVTSDASDRNTILSQALDREVTLEAAGSGREPGATSTSEAYWPDMEGLAHPDSVTEFELPEGTFFDAGVVNLLTTSTLERLRDIYPQGRFESPRFRPNLVVQTIGGMDGFVEDGWAGQTLAVGDEVRLSITRSCSRCVMTTLPQGDLPRDLDILRTIVKSNNAHVGVYASVVRVGTVRRGDCVRVV